MKKTKRIGQRSMAVLAVALLAMCALSVCIVDEESDAAYAKSFNIPMASGSTFTYTPTFNLTSGSITMSSSGTATTYVKQTGTNGLNNGTTFSGKFTNGTQAGASTQLVIKADWKSGDGALSQTATQTINFVTYTKVSLPSSLTSGKFYMVASDYASSGSEVARIQATGPSTVTTTGNFSSGPLTATHSAGGLCTIKTNKNITSNDAGTYSLTVTADDGKDGYVDQATMTYTFTIYPDLSITVNDPVIENYVGNTTGTASVTFNVPGVPSGSMVKYSATCDFGTTGITGSINADTGVFTVTSSGATRASVFTGSNANVDVVPFTINASATITYPNGAGTKTISGATATFKMYKDLAFESVPSVSSNVTYQSNGNPLDILLTAQFDGASKITYTWGDGTSTTVDDGPESGTTFSARHVYEKPGTYVIVTTAYNSNGMVSTYTIYDAVSDPFQNTTTGGEEDEKLKESFFDVHGYQFVLFAIITVALIVAIVVYGYETPTFIGLAVIAAMLTVLCFAYKDLGGVLEQLKTLLKL